MRRLLVLLAVSSMFLTYLPTPAPAATAAERQLILKNCILVVVNDLSGTHTVALGNSKKTLKGTGSRAVFVLAPSNGYVMLQLDGNPNKLYHLGAPTAGLKVIYTSQFIFGPF